MILQYFTNLLAIKEAFDASRLYDEKIFYQAFVKDLQRAKNAVVIESPFITIERVNYFLPTLKTLIKKDVQIHVYTRIVEEQFEEMQYQAEKGSDLLEEAGVFVIQTKGFLHRKLALIDKTIVWEGSLNILSQKYSKEVMRRIEDKKIAYETLKYLIIRESSTR